MQKVLMILKMSILISDGYEIVTSLLKQLEITEFCRTR